MFTTNLQNANSTNKNNENHTLNHKHNANEN